MIRPCTNSSKDTMGVIANVVALAIMVVGPTVVHGRVAATVMAIALLLLGAGILYSIGMGHAPSGSNAR